MQAFKFLRRGAIGPVSGFVWPTPSGGAPGPWVSTSDAPSPCSAGVHACRGEDLPYWIHQELWEVELDGEVTAAPDCIIARRGRLVRRVGAWSDGGGVRFAQACHDRLAARLASTPTAEPYKGYLLDCAHYLAQRVPSTTAYVSALTLARIDVLVDGADEWDGYRRERVWQSEWIVRQLIAS